MAWYLIISSVLELFRSSLHMHLCTLHIGFNAICEWQQEETRPYNLWTAETVLKPSLNKARLTYHVTLVMDHDCKVLEDLIHIHNIWLNQESRAESGWDIVLQSMSENYHVITIYKKMTMF